MSIGTNDCRGWVSRSVFHRFELPSHRLYQFRLAFEDTQAKGAFKVMEDDVAEKLGADVLTVRKKNNGLIADSRLVFKGFRQLRFQLPVRPFQKGINEFLVSGQIVEHSCLV